MNRANELQHLHRANVGIAEARERVWRQMELVARVERHGHDASSAKSVLSTMREALRLMEDHRKLITRELAR